jgi:hypothetical protein
MAFHNGTRRNEAPVQLNPQTIATALGGEVYRHDQVLAPGPGHSNEKRTLHVWIHSGSPDGFRTYSYAGDYWRDCRDHVRERVGMPAWKPGGDPDLCLPAATRPWPSGLNDEQLKRREIARKLWQIAEPARGTQVERYLEVRGIKLAQMPATVRYLKPRGDKYPHPTMIAPFAMCAEPTPGMLAVSSDAIMGVHLTRLRPDGSGKAGTDRDKIMLGPSMGTPLVLAPLGDGLGLIVSEGIEDSLSGHATTGLGAWAAGSAGRLPALAKAMPDYIEVVTILGHNDDAGRRGARELASLLHARGIAVLLPEEGL